MDLIFNCPKCEQELAVDSSGAGSEIRCPSCNEVITIPPAEAVGAPAGVEGGPGGDRIEAHPINAISSSAAAKVEMHLKVPVRDKAPESLISKPKSPLEVVQKGAGKRIRSRTIRHAACVESGHDKFDEKISDFLQEVGEGNVIGVHVINYEHFDVGIQKVMTDYGVLVIYRG